MERLVDFFELLVGNVGVNLRGSDRRVAKHRLDAADIGTVNQQIRGKRVAQSVRMDIFDDSSFDGVIFDDSLNGAGSKA